MTPLTPKIRVVNSQQPEQNPAIFLINVRLGVEGVTRSAADLTWSPSSFAPPAHTFSNHAGMFASSKGASVMVGDLGPAPSFTHASNARWPLFGRKEAGSRRQAFSACEFIPCRQLQ
jgi:hypothetical protein